VGIVQTFDKVETNFGATIDTLPAVLTYTLAVVRGVRHPIRMNALTNDPFL